jgi:uncharacterized membrane protein YbhN (UPF0104 family)
MQTETATQPKAQPQWSQVIRWLIGLGVAALSCWLLAQNVDWQNLGKALTSADYRWVITGVLAIIATFFTRTQRWRTLLWQSATRLRPTLTALLMGQVANMALPMRGGDMIRAAWIGPERGTGTVEALGSIAVEKVWDLVALLACGLILLVWIPLPDWFARSTWGTALALLVGGGSLLLVLRWQEPLFHLAGRLLACLPAGWDQALLPRLRRLANGLEAIQQTNTSLRAASWTGLTWTLSALANLAVLAAFGIPSAVAALFLLVALMLGGNIPIPGKLGIYEGICVISLHNLFHLASNERALAIGLVLRLIVMGPPLLAVILLTLLPHGRTRNTNERS